MTGRRTKILATLGPSTDAPGVIEGMVAAGLDGVRINCAHGTPDEWRARVAGARRAAAAAGRRIAVLFDLPGPKVRLGAAVAARRVEPGDRLLFAGGDPRDGEVPVAWPDLARAAVPGRSELVIGDGTPRFGVVGLPDGPVAGGRVLGECVEPGEIAPRKGAALTHARTDLPALTDADRHALDVAAEERADLVALSFVRQAEDVTLLRAETLSRGMRSRLVAKVEKAEACERLADILAVADGVMVARGDLGVEVGVQRVPLLQKEIIRSGLAARRLVITATQMLESMVTSAEPTRAEAADVANAILDGTSCVMLSAETAVGRDPVAPVRWMAEIALAAEAGEPRAVPLTGPATGHRAVMQAAALLAERLRARALIVPTHGGASARALSAHRPRRPVVALAHDPQVADQLALEWGVIPLVIPEIDEVEPLVDACEARAREVVGMVAGDTVVVAMGPSGAPAEGDSMVVARRLR
jgi:pyruvate kinase